MIKLENISKNFQSTEVLQNISLHIEKGEFIVLIGESGCGKTTLLKLLNRLIDPNQGSIFINGVDIKNQDVIELRRNLGYVIQKTGIFPHMTVEENLSIILKMKESKKEIIQSKIFETMEMVGLSYRDFKDRYPNELSGGQQQRVGVARALITDPDVILMDEPFSALDPVTRQNLQNEVVALQKKMNKTVVFVTHDMDEALKIADRICFLYKGRVIQFDTPENILKHPSSEHVTAFFGKTRLWENPQFIRVEDIMKTNFLITDNINDLRIEKYNVDYIIYEEDNQHKVLLKNTENNTFNLMPQTTTVCNKDGIMELVRDLENEKIYIVKDDTGTIVGIVDRTLIVSTLSYQYMEVETNA